MDTENSGKLTNEKLHALMQRQLALQHQNVTQRKLIIGLSVFAVVLALANMGTAFAAARLAQDTSLSGPPEVSGSTTSSNQQRRLGGAASDGAVSEEYVPQDVMISKEDGNIVGTRTVSGTTVNMEVEYTESHGIDDTGIMPTNKLPTYACVDLKTIAGMYNSIAEGSTASVQIHNGNADVEAGEMQNVAETYGRVGQSGANVVFFPNGSGNNPGLTVALGDDRCDDESVVPTRRGLRQNSSSRHLARSRHMQNIFQALTHADSRVRKAAQRILEASDVDGDVETTETREDVLDDAEVEQTDADYLANALGLEDIPEDELGSDSETLSDVDFLNQIFGGQFDTPFFYAEDINRVPVFMGGNFYIDFVPEEDGGNELPVFDPNAEQDEQDGLGNTSF